MPKFFQRIVSAMLAYEDWWNALKSRPAFKWGALVFVVAVFGIFVFVHPTMAAPPPPTEPGFLDRILLIMAGFFLALAQIIGQLVVLLLDIAAIPLMQYNGYGSSPVVAAGWAIVRDAVNMFFVVVLIVIAFGTIFGHSRFQWKQQVPKLLIFAIVINFSKTLAVLMIDFGQVVMLTFANAIKDIAGGNFIQLLGLADILSVSRDAATLKDLSSNSSTVQGPQAFDWLAAAIMAFLMMIIVLTTMVVLTVILAWRIVMLWVLVTIAPLAWFVGGAQDIVKSNAYADWWAQFKCYVAIGPVITFFVWLTLAVAGAGSIATLDTGFSQTAGSDPKANPADNLIGAFEVSKMTSFIIGIAMLFAGFQAAQTTCAVVPGIGQAFGRIGQTFGPQAAARLAKQAAVGAAGGAAYAGARGARLGMRGVRAGAGFASTEISGMAARSQSPLLRGLTAGGRAEMYRKVAQAAPGGAIGARIAAAAGQRAEVLEAGVAADVKGSGAGMEGATRETKLDYIGKIATSGAPMMTGDRNQAKAVFGQMMQDPKARESLEASGQMEKLWGMFGKEMKQDFKGDKSMTDMLDTFEDSRPDITKDVAGIKTYEQAQKLDPAALANKDVQDHLKAQMSGKNYPAGTKGKDKDGNDIDIGGTEMDMLEALRRSGSTKKRAAIDKGMTGVYEQMSAKNLATVPVEKIAPHANAAILNSRPDLAFEMLSSSNVDVQNTIENASPEIRQQIVMQGAGVGATGSVDDPDKLARLMKANPAAVGQFDKSQLVGAGGVPTPLGMSAANAITPDALSSVVSRLRKDPDSLASGDTREALSSLMTSVVSSGNGTPEMADAYSYFESEMDKLDAEIPQKTAALLDSAMKDIETESQQAYESGNSELGQKLAQQASAMEKEKETLTGLQSQIQDRKSNIKSFTRSGDVDEVAALEKEVKELNDQIRQISIRTKASRKK